MIFLNSASSAAALVFDLPLCTHTETEGKPREARVRNIIQKLRKNTIFNEHPVFKILFRHLLMVGKVAASSAPATDMTIPKSVNPFIFLLILNALFIQLTAHQFIN